MSGSLWRPAGLRARLVASVVLAMALLLGGLTALFNLLLDDGLDRAALVASIGLALITLVAVALAAHWLISKALRPVTQMTRSAAEWSEHDLDRRFSLGPPRDELTQLAATLDGLLERLAATLRHEQRLSAELSHELRTPLASIAADAQYALRHTRQSPEGAQALVQILDSARRMSGTLDTLIAAARAELDPHRASSDASECARAAIAACAPPGETGAPRLSLIAEHDGARVAVERDLVERILAPVLENAYRHARSEVDVLISREGAVLRFTIDDDGPGVNVDELEPIFEPGFRGSATATATVSRGAGLGLALARRLARAAGGDVRAEHREVGGRFTVWLPAA